MKCAFSRILLLLVFSAVFSSQIFCAPRRGQDLVESGHWVYDALAQLEIDVGRWNFIDESPLSVQTIQGILEDIPYERLSEAGKIQYERIREFFQEFDFSLDAGIFSIGIEPKVNLEFYAKTEDDLAWLYGNHERKRTLEAPLKITIGDYLSVFMGFAVGQRRRFLENENQNYVNHFFTEEAFDPNITHSTYLSTGYRWKNGVGLNFSLGYGKQNYGRAALGSTILSDYLTDIPYLQLRLYSPIFAYSFNVRQINPKTTFYAHTIDFRLFKKLTLGFMEGGAGYDDFEMSFINPLGIFHAYEMHNHYDWISYFAFKLNYVPIKNLRIYLLYSMDEHQLFTEDTSAPDSAPEAKSLQGGVELQFPIRNGFLRFNLEGYYADPYFMIKESPNWSLVSAKDGAYEWFGSPIGPDSVAGKFHAEYEQPGKFSVGLNYIFAARGEFSQKDIFKEWRRGNYVNPSEGDWIYPAKKTNGSYNEEYGRKYKTPHTSAGNKPEYDNIIYLRASYSPTKWFTIVAQPAYIFVFNHNNEAGKFRHGFEGAISARFDFCRIPKKPLNFDFLLKDKYDKAQDAQSAENLEE